MSATDSAFSGSIPDLYDSCLGPLLFRPYAEDMAAGLAALRPARILETAAGTGIVTAVIAAALPEAEIVATDLNQAMLDVAAANISSPRVAFRQADALALPFPDGGFDVLVCQFGVMFFPDRVAAYREARRALRPGGRFLFSVWDRIAANPAAEAASDAVAALFPDDPPGFLRRTPYGYHDAARIGDDLSAAGFGDIASETVARRSRGPSATDAATGLCLGSPLRAEIEARAPERLDEAMRAAAAAMSAHGDGQGGIDAPMSAIVFTAAA